MSTATSTATSKPIDTYATDAKCDLINSENPIYLSELYQNLDHLDNIDVAELAESMGFSYAGSAEEPLTWNDLFEGLGQLMVIGAVEVTEIIEAIHSEIILRPIGRFNEDHLSRWQQGLTRRVYNLVRSAMLYSGNNITSLSAQCYRKGLKNRHKKPLPDKLKLLVNVINGMMGDHLVTQNNKLAVPIVLYDRYGQPQRNDLSGRVVILCHGLCLSYLSWHPCAEDSLGENIALALPKSTVLYLDYNTGRRISQNGQCFASLLQELVDKNPEITQIDLVGYSMGGLVSRSAIFYAEQQGLSWYKLVGQLITLGTPHHGAVLERIGNHVFDIIGRVPFAGSLAKLGNIRSAGIIDLRHGSIRDEDWKYLSKRDVLPEHFRFPAKLPRHIKTFFVAGDIAGGLYDSKASSLVGDGLVSVESALGEDTVEHTLCVPEGHKAVFYEVNHINLQYDERVRRQVVEWLVDDGQTNYGLNPRVQSFSDDDLEVVV